MNTVIINGHTYTAEDWSKDPLGYFEAMKADIRAVLADCINDPSADNIAKAAIRTIDGDAPAPDIGALLVGERGPELAGRVKWEGTLGITMTPVETRRFAPHELPSCLGGILTRSRIPHVEPDPPKPFPARALRSGPGEAPLLIHEIDRDGR